MGHLPPGPSSPELWRLVCGLPRWCGNLQQHLGRHTWTTWHKPWRRSKQLALPWTSYLGWHLGNSELQPHVGKVEAMQRSPQTKTKKEVRIFLGLVGWYCRFIPKFATISTPLTNLLIKSAKNPVVWTEDSETAFNTLKICSIKVLQCPGGHFRKGNWRIARGSESLEKLVVFVSRKLLHMETIYSAIEMPSSGP